MQQHKRQPPRKDRPPPPRSNLIHVVAAVIYSDDRQKILITRRPDHLHQGGLWEFPGGKVEPGEQPRAALHRELNEELAIDVVKSEPFIEIRHDYADRQILLDVWRVWFFTGVPHGNEGQQLQWSPIRGLQQFAFPAANEAIIEALLQGR